MDPEDDRGLFLSTLPATSRDRSAAVVVVAISSGLFLLAVPYAGLPLTPVPAFVASYQSALAINDLITAVLLYSQFAILRTQALLWLASGYLFTAVAAVVHALSFPGLFAPAGLFHAGSQTTVWLFMIWHAGFPATVLVYARLKDKDGDARIRGSSRNAILGCAAAVVGVMSSVLYIATGWHDLLPILLRDGHYTVTMAGVVSVVWSLCLAALLVLWGRRPHSVIDIWLMVVLCAWLFDIALSAMLNVARYDLGFYAGRVYGLCAASLVLGVLLSENVALQAQLSRLVALLRRQSAAERDRHSGRERLTEQALHQQIEERRRIFETSQDLLLVADIAAELVQVSPSSIEILGYRPEQMLGRSVFDFIDPDDRERLREAMRQARDGRDIRDVEAHSRHSNGSAVILSWMGTWSEPVRRHFLVGRDLTEKHAVEAQYRQAQKMDAIGQLTGGIAHDFNNILTVIIGAIGILSDALMDRPQLAAITRMIEDAADRGAHLTQHLLAFARKQPLQPCAVDVNSLILQTAKLLRPTLGEQIEVEPSLAPEAWTALVDPSQLTTAILNLALNARDAMPVGGKLVIETSNVDLDEAYARQQNDVVAGSYLLVAVSDTGAGIAAADLDRVFDPFFTTKEVGKGTGLGLSMVFGFVKQSGGHIKIYSEQGHGTTVKLYLPRANATEQSPEISEAPPITGGDEVVLVVEDDALVRGYVVAQIESLGYRSLAAANAAEALQLIDSTAPIDLLFTDVILPGNANGRLLVEEALRRRPMLKTLYTSGYAEDAIVHHGRLDPGVLLLVKPYRKSDLARMIRMALSGRSVLQL